MEQWKGEGGTVRHREKVFGEKLFYVLFLSKLIVKKMFADVLGRKEAFKTIRTSFMKNAKL